MPRLPAPEGLDCEQQTSLLLDSKAVPDRIHFVDFDYDPYC